MYTLASAARWALGDFTHVRTILQFDLFSGDETECLEGKFSYTQKLKEISWSLLWKVLANLLPNSQQKQGASENKGIIVDSFDRQVMSTAEAEGHTIVSSVSPFTRLRGKIKGQRSGDVVPCINKHLSISMGIG